MTMLVLLPREGQFATFETSLDASRIAAIASSLTDQEVELSLPKFKVETTLSLREILAGMGLTDAFAPASADFSGIDGARDLFVAVALHKAYVAVDEAGTEAGAATVIGGATAAPGEWQVVTVNRPFLFLIRDRATGTVLFLGRVTNPTA
jgi:serpin B